MICPLCQSSSEIKYQRHPSYIEDLFFKIVFCDNCNTSFVDPIIIDTTIYEKIYINSSKVSGYDRYYQIANMILEKKDPLAFLKRRSLEYSFIIDEIKKSYKNGDLILEVGCGIGYMTYALNFSGYLTVGTDIVDNVIDLAIKKFGNHYHKGGIDLLIQNNHRFDFIILTEVIEHIEDPISFIDKLNSLLNKNGSILLSTPNKSAFSKKALWVTDAPPVHLWWFSEESIHYLAKKTSMIYKIIKPRYCNGTSYYYLNKSERIDCPIFVPGGSAIIIPEVKTTLQNTIFQNFITALKYLLCFMPFKRTIVKVRNKLMNNCKSEIPYTLCVQLYSEKSN